MAFSQFLAHVGLCLTFLSASALAADGEATTPPPEAPKGLLPIPDYSGDWLTRSHLAGDFNGGRTQLANHGVQIDVDWTQYAQSIVAGGRDSDSHYGGHLDYLMHLDLMRMGLIPGGLLTVRAESRYGQSVNGAAGQILPVNTTAFFPITDNLDDGLCIAVTNLYYTQFLSEQFAVFAGKIDTLDGDPNEFASGRGKTQFMDANFLFDSSAALRLPYSTLGVGFKWLPNPNVSLSASVMNTADSSTTTGFEDFGDGYTASGELDVQYRLGDLPGGMNVGGLYSWDQKFAQIRGQIVFEPGLGIVIPTDDSTWAIYWSMWQYLWVQDPDDKPINTG
ncbi:MAG TPA: carbohydrate porin, partial [Tepidisphaeraceae bacterium]